MKNYPSVLPQPSRDGYRGAYSQREKRHEMDDGQFRGPRKWGSLPFQYSLTWRLNNYKLAQVFEAWVEYTLNAGVEYCEIPLAGAVVKVRPVDGKPVYIPAGAGWTVTMTFEEIRAKPGPWKGRAVWPATLPMFEKSGFQIMPTQGPIRSDIEGGLSEVRNRFRSRVTTYTGKMLMSTEQRNTFWNFYRDDLMNGHAAFIGPFANAMGERVLRAKIVESPVESPEGSHFWLNFAMETTEAPLMSSTEYFTEIAVYVNDYCEPGYVENDYVGYYRIGD